MCILVEIARAFRCAHHKIHNAFLYSFLPAFFVPRAGRASYYYYYFITAGMVV